MRDISIKPGCRPYTECNDYDYTSMLDKARIHYNNTACSNNDRLETEIISEYRMRVSSLNRKIFNLLGFISSEGYWEEAMDYLVEHMDDEVPFEFS